VSAPPISAELWSRLRKLDPQCSIHLCRGAPNARRWERAVRTWRVSIHHERAKIWQYVETEHPTLAEALRVAVDEAERLGWTMRVLRE
jgi:hypothetical protein